MSDAAGSYLSDQWGVALTTLGLSTRWGGYPCETVRGVSSGERNATTCELGSGAMRRGDIGFGLGKLRGIVRHVDDVDDGPG